MRYFGIYAGCWLLLMVMRCILLAIQFAGDTMLAILLAKCCCDTLLAIFAGGNMLLRYFAICWRTVVAILC